MAVKNVFRILDLFLDNPDKEYSLNRIRTLLGIDVRTIQQVISYARERGWLEEIPGKVRRYKWGKKYGN